MSAPSADNAAFRIDPTLLQQLKGIELKSRRLVRGLYHNRHRTRDHGSSTEFVEHREYAKGDEIRHIDWRVYARTDRHYVKVHEHEANLSVHLVLDTSDSMRVPAPPGLPTKLELGATVAGAIAIMAQTRQDSVGLLCVGEKVHEQVPARQGQRHLGLLMQHLAQPTGGGGGNFAEPIRAEAHRFGRRAMVFLISDALDDPVVLFDALKLLRAREQDVTLIQMLDRNELEFPFDRMSEFRHPETGERLVGNPSALREKYLERLHRHLAAVENDCQRSHAEYLRLSNHDDLGQLLSLHFIRRLLRGVR